MRLIWKFPLLCATTLLYLPWSINHCIITLHIWLYALPFSFVRVFSPFSLSFSFCVLFVHCNGTSNLSTLPTSQKLATSFSQQALAVTSVLASNGAKTPCLGWMRLSSLFLPKRWLTEGEFKQAAAAICINMREKRDAKRWKKSAKKV